MYPPLDITGYITEKRTHTQNPHFCVILCVHIRSPLSSRLARKYYVNNYKGQMA